MVASAMHYIIGVAIVWLFGIKDNRKYLYGLWAVAPDMDAIFLALFRMGSLIFGYDMSIFQTSEPLMIIFSHRGLSHSLLLFVIVMGIIYIVRKKSFAMIGILWSSHFLIDMLTQWKSFPLLPFSYRSVQLGFLEIYDSFLLLFTTLIIAVMIGISIKQKAKKGILVFAYIFLILFGIMPSVFFQEFTPESILISQILFWIIVGAFVFSDVKIANAERFIRKTIIVMVAYVCILVIVQGAYAAILDTSITNLEPLPEFTFTYNAHTFEIDEGDHYRIGVISLRGIEEEKEVPKIIKEGDIPDSEIQAYLTAYKKSLYLNWINNPVWKFSRAKDGSIVANINYAKNYLDNQYKAHPVNGITPIRYDGVLVHYFNQH